MPITFKHLACISMLSAAAIIPSPARAQPAPPGELPLLQPVFDSESAIPREDPLDHPCFGYSCFSTAVYEGRRFAGVGSSLAAVYVVVRDDSGAVRVEAELPVPEPSIYDDGTPDGAPATADFYFGRALALDGKELMVSHRRSDALAGTVDARVYVFARSRGGWSHRQTIPLGDCTNGERYLDLDDGTALLGTCVFERNRQGQYEFVTRLTTEDGQPLEPLIRNGKETALDGRTVVIGTPLADEWTGAAYVFRRIGLRWRQVARLVPGAGAELGQFGAAVDVDGDLVAIGAPHTPGATPLRAGVVHLYTRRGLDWEPTQVLTNPIPPGADPTRDRERDFGGSVTLDGGRVLVGSSPFPSSSAPGGSPPGAYLYQRNRSSFVATHALDVFWVTSVHLSGNFALASEGSIRAEYWFGFDVPAPGCH